MTKASFEIAKGRQDVLNLSEAEVTQHLDPAELLRELEASFGALARGEVQCPPRPQITIPGKGFSLSMSAWQPAMQICVKVVNVFDGNLARGLPNHLAIINLFDPETGAATCVMDATYITGIRTAAWVRQGHTFRPWAITRRTASFRARLRAISVSLWRRWMPLRRRRWDVPS